MPSGLFTRRQHLQAVITNSWAGRPSSVDYLVIAGGGAGGDNPDPSNGNGGGGAGGLLQGTVAAPTTATTVTVGSGSGRFDAAGGDSVFGSITSKGGGSGARHNYFSGLPGGSGGGGSSGSSFLSGGQGIFGQGNAGGIGLTTNSGGGGGGAGSVGLNGITNVGGSGGAGIASDISGSRVLYAGGGGGGVLSGGTSGAGGIGGGGTGNGTAGVPNTGSGGGSAPNYGNAGTGGSGIVIVSYPGTTQWYSGGTLSFAENRVVHTFYSSGTLTPIQPVEFADTTYQISRSLRFNSADSAYLNRTPSVAGNRKTWTWSAWIKRSKLSDWNYLFQGSAGNPTGLMDDGTAIRFVSTTNELQIYQLINDSTSDLLVSTAQVLRDTSAWYHLVVAMDTTQSIASNRVRMYINGIEVTLFTSSTYPARNAELYINTTNVHLIGSLSRDGGAAQLTYDGYMAEVNFIDGQQLTAQAFGFNNPNTGVWSPLRYTGSYGTNGFYLNFSDNSNNTAATLGKDSSGNGLNWTPNNFSITAGAGNDSLIDSPTAYGTDTGLGGEMRGNYATLNPLYGTGITANFYASNGNLDLNVDSNSGYRNLAATFSPENFKGYFEVYCSTSPNFQIGFAFESIAPSNIQYQNAGTLYINDSGDVKDGSTTIKSTCTSSFSSTNVLQVAFDFTNGARNVWFGRNGTWGSNSSGVGVPSTGTNPVLTSSNITSASRFYFAINSGAGTVTIAANFGQRPFAYTAPSGYKALCTQNLPTPTIGATTATQANKYFNTVTYTGSGTSNRIIPTGLQSDFVWIKRRDAVMSHLLHDVVRGAGKTLYAEQNIAEANNGSYYVQQFNSDNFLIGLHDTAINANGATYVAWNWRAGGAGVTNTSGSITSTVSANQTSGFSIVRYNGTSANATIGHGLGVAPKLIIRKYVNDTDSWYTYHASLGPNKYLALNETSAAITNTSIWQNTAPTSTVFYIGSGNNNSNSVAYCFAEVAGYSKFGSYTGNGSTDGPFVYTGFRPAYVLAKRTDGTSVDWVWWVQDNKRGPYNATAGLLKPNSSDAENSSALMDFVSNGFKLRNASGSINANGGTYIYAAFAETPFKYSRAR